MTILWSTDPPGRGSFSAPFNPSTLWTAPVVLIFELFDRPDSSATARVTVNPVTTPVNIGGNAIGSVTETGTSPGDIVATNTLTITTTSPNKNFIEQSDTPGTYGNFSIDASGTWRYVLDDANPATDALAAGEMVEDVFTVAADQPDGVPRRATRRYWQHQFGSGDRRRWPELCVEHQPGQQRQFCR